MTDQEIAALGGAFPVRIGVGVRTTVPVERRGGAGRGVGLAGVGVTGAGATVPAGTSFN